MPNARREVADQDYRTEHRADLWRKSVGGLSGYVATTEGVVGVVSGGDNHYLFLVFVWCGRTYSRLLTGQPHTERGISILAGRFAREIAGGAR